MKTKPRHVLCAKTGSTADHSTRVLRLRLKDKHATWCRARALTQSVPYGIVNVGATVSPAVLAGDRENNAVPELADVRVVVMLSISQSNRWYYWRAKELPAPAHILNAHMANVHIVPARPALKTILLGVRAKDLVSLRGHLIDARHVESNTVFRSSRTKTDTGAGACEILLVTDIGLL